MKTDNPVAELYLLDATGVEIDNDTWQADRELSIQLHAHIEQLLKDNNCTYADVEGLVVYAGPGSFTGLRISITVANTMAYALNIPITGETGSDWLRVGAQALDKKEPGGQVLPEYGGEANITKPRK